MKPVVGVLGVVILAFATTVACSNNSGRASGAPLSVLSPTPVSFVGDRLVFESNRDGANAVYLADGTIVRRVAAGSRPALTRDGLRVAFNCELTVICVVNADGSAPSMIAQGYDSDWSPDGTRIVYTTDGGLFTVAASGGTPAKIVDSSALRSLSGWEVGIITPAWSPDGSTIVFVAKNYDDPSQMYLVNPDGSGLRLTGLRERVQLSEADPFWSPDGAEIGARTYSGVDAFNLRTSTWRSVAAGLLLYATWSSRGDLAYSKQTGPGPTSNGSWESRIFIEEGGQERQLIPDVESPVRYADVRPDWGH